MKTLAIALFALLTATAGCATDAPEPEMPRMPGDEKRDVIIDDRPEIEESFEIGTPDTNLPRVDDGRSMWVEVITIDDSPTTRLHLIDADTGIETIAVIDDDGTVQRVIETRYSPTTIAVDDVQ